MRYPRERIGIAMGERERENNLSMTILGMTEKQHLDACFVSNSTWGVRLRKIAS